MATPKLSIAFDLYGTLVSTDSIADHVVGICHNRSQAELLTSLWRRYQLEYSWRITAMGQYRPFPDLTRAALAHAAAEAGVALTDEATAGLLAAYDGLAACAGVEAALAAAGRRGARCAVFSNGTAAAVAACVAAVPALAAHAALLAAPVSVDDGVRAFKPAPAAYAHLRRALAADGAPLWLVTANPFDVVGARASGISVAWIDRAGTGWIDRLGDLLGDDVRPSYVATGVDSAVEYILETTAEGREEGR